MEFRLTQSPPLDGLRAISILLVLAAHIHLLAPDLPSIFVGGFLGVDVFFVISGFLITSLLLDEHRSVGRVSLRKFYIRRALRLLPALAGVLLFTSALAALLGSLSFVDLSAFRLLSIIGYFMNWVRAFEAPQSWFLGHFWSLSVEEQFYSVWPAVVLFLLRRNHAQGAALLTVGAGIVASCALKSVLFIQGASPQRLIFGSDTRAEPILIGCLLAFALHWNHVPVWLDSRALVGLSAVVVAVFAIAARQEMTVMYFGGFTLFATAVAVLILKTTRDQRCELSRALSTPMMVWIGRRSYGIYLWHWPVFKLTKAVAPDAWAFVPLALLCTLSIAALSYRYLESPFLALKKRYSSVGADKQPGSREPQFSQVVPAIAR